ncbi:MAG: PAS domain-containing protein [Leptolyngbyaceae cyanobacterium bins.302]|nr:PAS domain-containing protein [Leptolyngbyaceae cyanobacterium bins.302]
MSVYPNPCPTVHASSCSVCMIEALAKFQAQIVRLVPGCLYIYDLIEQHTVCASRPITEVLGYTDTAIQTMALTGLSELIHPDDLDIVANYYQHLTMLKTGDITALEYRMQRPDGTWCWLRSQEAVLTQAIAGYPLQILGVTYNLSTLSPFKSRKRIWLNRLIKQRITITANPSTKLSPVSRPSSFANNQ